MRGVWAGAPARAMGGDKGAGPVPPLAGVYELSARPNTGRAADLARAAWDAAMRTALVERPNKHTAAMGRWAARKQALFPEEALLLVEQGLLLLRSSAAGGVLSVAEAQALALGEAELCPLYFEVFAHVRELGLAALRLELLHGGAERPADANRDGGGACAFRGRPVLALWGAERAGQKGFRQTRPDSILATARASDALPSASEWAALEAVAARVGATVKIAVADGTGSPVIFGCSRFGPPARPARASRLLRSRAGAVCPFVCSALLTPFRHACVCSGPAGGEQGSREAAGRGKAEEEKGNGREGGAGGTGVDIEAVQAQIALQGDKVCPSHAHVRGVSPSAREGCCARGGASLGLKASAGLWALISCVCLSAPGAADEEGGCHGRGIAALASLGDRGAQEAQGPAPEQRERGAARAEQKETEACSKQRRSELTLAPTPAVPEWASPTPWTTAAHRFASSRTVCWCGIARGRHRPATASVLACSVCAAQ